MHHGQIMQIKIVLYKFIMASSNFHDSHKKIKRLESNYHPLGKLLKKYLTRGCWGKGPPICIPPLHCPASGWVLGAAIGWPGIGCRKPPVADVGPAGVQPAPPVLLRVLGEFHWPLLRIYTTVLTKYTIYTLETSSKLYLWPISRHLHVAQKFLGFKYRFEVHSC